MWRELKVLPMPGTGLPGKGVECAILEAGPRALAKSS